MNNEKRPGFTEVTDPALLNAMERLAALCSELKMQISGQFTVWVGPVGCGDVDCISSDGHSLWRSSFGQVRSEDDQ